MTDEELLHALKTTRTRGWSSLCGDILLVYTILLVVVGTPEDTEELVADVFVELWRSRENGDNDYRNDRTVGLQFFWFEDRALKPPKLSTATLQVLSLTSPVELKCGILRKAFVAPNPDGTCSLTVCRGAGDELP